MKRALLPAVIVASAALLSSSGVLASGGGHHGGGGVSSGFSGSHGGYTGGGYHGYSGSGLSRGPGSHGPGPGYSGYTRGNYGRGAGTYGRTYYSTPGSAGRHTYGSSPGFRSRTGHGQVYRNQSGFNHTNRVSRVYHPANPSNNPGLHQNGTRVATGNPPGQRDRTASEMTWSQRNSTNRSRLDPRTADRLRGWHGRTPGLAEARNNYHHHHHHDHPWWHHHCDAIVLAGWGYWGWDAGWWYPAWGYDPYYSYYEYDGPIYGYDGLPPDQVIANVQGALQQEGYFPYAADGVLGPLTQAALQRFQQDHGLSITGAIDPPTLTSLGFIR